MATLFVLFFLFAIFHFIYESILTPMFRLELRYRLFEIRDRLRQLKITHNKELSDEIFDLLDESACSTIRMLPNYNFANIYLAFNLAKGNVELKEKVEKHQKLISASSVKGVREIDRSIVRSAGFALAINSGGWIYIFVPIALIVFLSAFVLPGCRAFIFACKKLIYKISYAGESALPLHSNYAIPI